MTLQEAEVKRNKHLNLVGTTIRNKKITNLVVVPFEEYRIGEILGRIYRDRSYEDILDQYSNFDVLVIFDFDKFHNKGFATWDTLESILKTHRLR